MIVWINLNPKQKIYASTGTFLAVLLLIVIFIITPLISQIKSDGLELAQKKQSLETFYSNHRSLESAQKNYQNAQDEIYALPALLPSSDALKFILLMEKFAQITGNSQNVSINNKDNNKTGVLSAPADKKTLDFQVSLNGDFPSLVKFLTYLENAPYYNDIDSIRSQRQPDKKEETLGTAANGNLNTVLEISVYQ